MAAHNDLGNYGEQLAVEYLVSKGYKILETNWMHQHKEIDIIAKKDPFIVFVEVKTRRTNYFGEPFMFVNNAKQRLLVKAANAYVQKFNVMEEARFDIISVLYNEHQKDITHIEDAFYARM